MLNSYTLIGALVLTSAAASAQDVYRLKAEEPTTGSHINSETFRGSIPLNRRYEELTHEQQASLKAQYEHMEEDDEPPYPAQGTATLARAFSKLQQRFYAKGKLLLIVDVDSQGVAQNVSAVGDFDPELVKAASTVLLLTPFKPAKCKGVACRMSYPYRVEFNIKY